MTWKLTRSQEIERIYQDITEELARHAVAVAEFLRELKDQEAQLKQESHDEGYDAGVESEKEPNQ